MTQHDFTKALAQALGTTDKAADKTMRQALRLIGKALAKDGRFEWRGFGVWWVGTRAARKILNPQTGKTIRLPKMLEVRFRAARSLKESQARFRRRAA